MDYQSVLKNLHPVSDYFIGIDSDGCVFDSMEVKQKEFFIPNALKHFDLFPISKILRETWEFVNLFSVYRGGNRFTSLIKVFELVNERSEIKESGFKLPDLSSLKEWVKIETRLGNATLRKYLDLNYNPDLEKVMEWSESVNNDIRRWLRDIPPFPNSIVAIREISSAVDLIIVSQTPLDALQREWEEHGLIQFVKAIAAQEHGTKTEHIALAAKGKYADDKILMIGDARGDMEAARNNGILFYPVLPGNEDKSWKRFLSESYDKFKKGEYAGAYEESLLTEFNSVLPEIPVWGKGHA